MLSTTPCICTSDELEASRASEQQLRQRTCEAIRAAEAEAHRSVEDSYQEASFAVHKALERVDAAVAEAAEAQGRAKQLEMADAEARAELKAAREEISRWVVCVGATSPPVLSTVEVHCQLPFHGCLWVSSAAVKCLAGLCAGLAGGCLQGCNTPRHGFLSLHAG